jgi:hypothetical protein
MNLEPTLGAEEWLCNNEDALKKLLPDTWTHIHNVDGLKLGFGLKLLGVDWRSENEFARILVYFERIGLLIREGMAVKRNPCIVFKAK